MTPVAVGELTTCTKRLCNTGWICDCNGQYLCNRGDRTTYILNNANDEATPSATCAPVIETHIVRAGIKLGFWHPLISETGVQAQDCHELMWFYNGVQIADFPVDLTVDTPQEAIDATLERSDWNDFPFVSGDVIAFRWRLARLSCYAGVSEMSVNGTTFDTKDTSKVIHTVSNNFEADWETQDFIESANFSLVQQTDYISNQPVSNYYFRIKIL